MLWEISYSSLSLSKDRKFVAIRDTQNQVVTLDVPLEAAEEIVKEHNRTVERALCAGLGIKVRGKPCHC